ncbi:hypothetical protein ACFFMR_29390 [Micromonospora andamanensis]|uniref:Secreted protein/lipoprotein n=1 Tax=Micromonospora andamanensis TaxID=1287068 RepID=A0ABQ4HRX3_9ACTN|nr:hypothetical protein [Micromonospora andamanensis]GIJ08393.1 hypothetical protein Van01_16070 [Micromonospora andamanensis]
MTRHIISGIQPVRPCRRLVGLLIGLSLAPSLGACGPGTSGDDSPASRPPTPPASVPAPSAPAEDAALLAYQGMWRAYAKAGLTADPQEPELARYATGRALSTLRSGLTRLREDGNVIKGEYQSEPQVIATTPATPPGAVTVQDCLDSTQFLTYTRSGALADDIPGGRRAVRATVIRDGDGWKVSSFGVQAVGTC